VGCGLPSGKRRPAFGRAARPAATARRAFQRAVSLGGRAALGRAPGGFVRSSALAARRRPRHIVSGKTTGTTLLAYRQITLSGRIAPLFLQFSVRVKRPRVRRNVTRRRHSLPLLDADCRDAMVTRFDCKRRTRRKTGRHDRDALNYA